MSARMFGPVSLAAATALLLKLASANPAIITSAISEGMHDVALNVSSLALLPGLVSWEDLAFTSLQEPWFSTAPEGLSTEDLEKLAVLDIASGTLCEHTDGCMADIAGHYQSLVDAEAEIAQGLVKRFRYIYKWINSGWKTSGAHKVTAAALGTLSSSVSGATTTIIELSRSALCAKEDGNQACLSWAGGVQAIKRNIALDIIGSAQGTFGQDAVSGEEYAAVFSESTKRKRSAGNDVCVSNRPNGCT